MPETTQFGGMNDANQNDGALQANQILLARYKIEGQLGGGGQGAVYQARDLNFPDARRLVAIKEMNVTSPDPNLRAATMKTFQREANILATLGHPAIPKIYDFFDQNDKAYLVMEYINGRDLEAILVKTKTLPMEKIIEWGIDLCDVLQYLHNHQPEPIIFRDMKPANIMIDSLGKVRLIDFGIAKIFVSGLPQTMIGTEGYSAPEQYKGKANPLSDIYSLGATLHHVITRSDPRLQPPFSFSERPITEHNDEASPDLASIIEKMLEFEPENRYPNLTEVKEALLAVRYGNTRTATIPASASNAPEENGDAGTNFFAGQGATGIEPRWTFKVEDEIRSSPVAYRNMVFIGSYDTNIWAFNMEDGNFLWKEASDGGIATTPVVDPEYKLVMAGSEDYTFAARDIRDGRLQWTYTTGDKIRGTARLSDGRVFFGSDDGKVYALIANNGRFIWEYETGSPVRSTPFVTNDRIIFGDDSGEVTALALDGTRRWGFRTRRAVTSSPLVDKDNICYIGSMDGFLYALDADNSFSQWRFRTNGPIISSPALEDGFVFIASTDGRMYCVNAITGKERWSFETSKPIISSPVVFNGVVYFGGTDKNLYAVDAKTGKEIWSFTAGGEITATPLVNESFIIFGSMDRTLYALPLISR